jgi:hypothetical protein
MQYGFSERGLSAAAVPEEYNISKISRISHLRISTKVSL